jgi:hypothetical protein
MLSSAKFKHALSASTKILTLFHQVGIFLIRRHIVARTVLASYRDVKRWRVKLEIFWRCCPTLLFW